MKSNVAVLLVLTLLVSSCGGTAHTQSSAPMAQPIHTIVPAPASVRPGQGGAFAITPTTSVLIKGSDKRVVAVGNYLARLISSIEAPAQQPVETAADAARDGSIHLSLGASADVGDEGYELIVTAQRVTLTAAQPAGLFYGVQTLRHLLPASVEYEAVRKRTLTIPPIQIVDKPRFPWRGAMLDVARHFFGADDVKRYVDLIALLKMNRLHLHLADDQGWRIEIKSWPNLTTHGGSTKVGGGPGGFYSQAQFTDIVAYAAARYITVVPEIDMPGHTNAALASYAQLNCDGVAPPLYTGIEVGFSALCVDKDITYKFIDDVVREISALVPTPYFHIGGDEVKKLTPDQYAKFIERVQTIVQSHKKQMIGWDEVAPVKLLPTSIVQHWRPKESPQAAVAKGAKIIFSPAEKVYLDMKYDAATALGLDWAALIEVRPAYEWDPATLVSGVPEASILGVEAPLWTETVVTMRDVEFMAFPRIAAVAEIGWTPAAARTWDEFSVRLGAQAARWAAMGINFYRSPQVRWADRRER